MSGDLKLSPDEAMRSLKLTLEEQGCHLTDAEVHTAMARVGAPEVYDEALMVLLVEAGLHCWANKDRTAAMTTALGMNQLGLEKELKDLQSMFNEMLGLVDTLLQTSGLSDARNKVETLRAGLKKKPVVEAPKRKNKAKEEHPEWKGLTYEQAFKDPYQKQSGIFSFCWTVF